jgi:hypothetical protein
MDTKNMAILSPNLRSQRARGGGQSDQNGYGATPHEIQMIIFPRRYTGERGNRLYQVTVPFLIVKKR